MYNIYSIYNISLCIQPPATKPWLKPPAEASFTGAALGSSTSGPLLGIANLVQDQWDLKAVTRS